MNKVGFSLLLGVLTFGLQAANQGPKIDLLGNAEYQCLFLEDRESYTALKQNLITQINENWRNPKKQIAFLKSALIEGFNPSQWIISIDDTTGRSINASVQSFASFIGDPTLLYLLKHLTTYRARASDDNADWGFGYGINFGTKCGLNGDPHLSIYSLLNSSTKKSDFSSMGNRTIKEIIEHHKLLLIQILFGQNKHCLADGIINDVFKQGLHGIKGRTNEEIRAELEQFKTAAVLLIKLGVSLEQPMSSQNTSHYDLTGKTFRQALATLKRKLASTRINKKYFPLKYYDQTVQAFAAAEKELAATREGLKPLLIKYLSHAHGPASVIESYVDGDVMCASIAQELAPIKAEMEAKLAACVREYQPEIDQARAQHRELLWQRDAPERQARALHAAQRQLMQGDREQDFLDLDDRTLRYGADEEFDAWTNSMQEGSGPNGGSSSSSSSGSNGFQQLSLAPGRQPQPHGYGNGASSSSSSSQQPQARAQLQAPAQQQPAGNGSSSSSSSALGHGVKRKLGDDNVDDGQNPSKRLKKDEPNNGSGSASASSSSNSNMSV